MTSQVTEAIEAARAAAAGERLPGLDELQAAGGRVQTALGVLTEELEARVARGSEAQRKLWRLLRELQQIERELIERRYVRRVDALERVQEAVRGLGEIGSATGILDRSAAALGESSDFDRVLVSRVAEGAACVEWAWSRAEPGDALVERLPPMRLEYPLAEADLSRAAVVVVADGRVDRRWSELLGWSSYAVAALTLGGSTVGMIHADRSDRPVDEIDREALEGYAEGLAQVFERAVLRGRLRGHRTELRRSVDWMNARLSSLTEGGSNGAAALPVGADAMSEVAELDELLTPRELEVLRLMARGKTNASIAKSLVVAEGTVKYHVKNILRKLRAANRADAVARYERMTAGAPE